VRTDGLLHPLPGQHRKFWTLSADACALGARMAASVSTLAEWGTIVLHRVGEREGSGVPTASPPATRSPGRPRLSSNGVAPETPEPPLGPVTFNREPRDLYTWLRGRDG